MSEMKVTLFRVEAHDTREGRLALLPGVPRELFVHPEVRTLQQGSVIGLRLPSGTVDEVSIADYYIRTSATPTEAELASAPIVLVLPEGVSREEAPVGTDVEISVCM